MNRMRWAACFAAVMALAFPASLSACCDCDPPTNHCELFAEICHGLSDPLADECHKLGHAGDEAACTARKDECLAACKQAGAGGTAGAGGMGGAGGSG